MLKEESTSAPKVGVSIPHLPDIAAKSPDPAISRSQPSKIVMHELGNPGPATSPRLRKCPNDQRGAKQQKALFQSRKPSRMALFTNVFAQKASKYQLIACSQKLKEIDTMDVEKGRRAGMRESWYLSIFCSFYTPPLRRAKKETLRPQLPAPQLAIPILARGMTASWTADADRFS